jgi:hypothetical protein
MVVFLLNVDLFSQTANSNKAFFSLDIGGTITAREDFDQVYSSKFGISYGAGFGIPLSSKLYIYGKATYFSKTGVPIFYTLTYDTTSGEFVKTNERKEGSASYSQWFFNPGLQYNFILSDEYTFAINGGFTFTRTDEEQKGLDGSTSIAKGSGLLGYFGGIALEKNFIDSPFSIFAEAQYNFSRQNILNVIGNYGGTNLALGIHYYFKDRRKQ